MADIINNNLIDLDLRVTNQLEAIEALATVHKPVMRIRVETLG